MTVALLAAAALAAAAGLRRLWRIAAAGAAYKAKALCTALFVCGRDLDPDTAPEANAEAYRIMRLFRSAVDREKKTVTCSLAGLRPRTAVFRPGLGATLCLGPLAAMDPGSAPANPNSEAWPRGEAPAPPAAGTLARLLDEAFSEPDPRRLRRTRAVLVARDGRLLAERYAPGFGPDTRLPGWSMAKAVTSALVGALVGEGKLSLDGKRLLREWSAEGDPRAAITLEDLLRMRSGLRFAEKYADPLSDVVQMLVATPDAGGFAASRPLAHAPGSRWQYASGTTNILSLILRRTLGDERYAAFPRRSLFGPLGMSSAVFEPDASGTYVGSSFLAATARDWARFGQLYAQEGVWDGRPLLPSGWVAFSASPTPQSPEGCYGAHWWLKLQPELGGGTPDAERLPADARHMLGHEGQCVTVVPSRGLVVVRLGLSIRIDAWNHAAFLARVLDAV